MSFLVLYAGEPRGLPLKEKLLPQYLKDLGYVNHIVGKWHLGHYKREYTPLHRGFESHIGYWTGHHDYFDHTAYENPSWGFDIRRNMDVAFDLHGQYTTDIIARESVRVIREHNATNPLFLYIAHAAVHSGNPYNPLPAPDLTTSKFTNINNFQRRKFAGKFFRFLLLRSKFIKIFFVCLAMLTHLDNSVGNVVQALERANMLKDSIIVFSTDNGGPAEGLNCLLYLDNFDINKYIIFLGFNLNAASNWPLRGVKNTLWEGGVRGAALLWSPLLQTRHRVANQTMHISDWLPTLYHAAGGNVE